MGYLLLLPQDTGLQGAGEMKMTLLDLAIKGGWVMIPIILLSFIAAYIFIERYYVIKRASKEDLNFMNRIKDYIHDGKIDAAVALCRSTDSPSARMVEKGISRLGRPLHDINTAIENVGKLEISKLEKGFPTLATIAGAEPMLGFLGTVIGMVKSFYAMSQAGSNVEISTMSSGIYTALITTVAGLAIGILCFFAYNFLVERVEKVVFNLEATLTEFMDILNEPVKTGK
ncbi:MAG TPA: MotA/TolQ/ExbB proton channel family protein [Bacteroidales bacterium]|nr:MotA/TolQ/ExbB proton channel family protein [Bacteroidales bacterium]HOK75403.1 MotA/TolQ/ExbB proton channel family protein [Bacteroidales bacterium]HOM40789.1 MotA/TolQ/ExbB proton channel family protein [Bacteroidales bacterium]HOU29795.1 MotA/TolQ/ExbB proton channel family protein [Bacteroidales bacterium]HPP92454.1 MotA/TolQ/ExbB proton channel family protein [Bacteroidales bacterium]